MIPDPRLPQILALSIEDAEEVRESEHQAAADQAERLGQQLRTSSDPIESREYAKLARDHMAALRLAKATRHRNAWLWHLGHRW